MSGGEQQMLAIGRALMARPRLLMLDEPSMGIAPILVQRIYETIGEINRFGVTILLVEQNANYALEVSSRAYVLETGKIALQGESGSCATTPRCRRPTWATTVLALIGAKALYLLMAWLLSIAGAAWLTERKGYGEKLGLALGMLLSVVGLLLVLLLPGRPGSAWRVEGWVQAQQGQGQALTRQPPAGAGGPSLCGPCCPPFSRVGLA